jgi:MFS family permease
MSSFTVALTVVQPTLGWSGGRLGNRRLYLGSLSLYVVTSMLCGLGPRKPELFPSFTGHEYGLPLSPHHDYLA